MQFVMYRIPANSIYSNIHFITFDIYTSEHAFPITILQNISCKCAKRFSFWETSPRLPTYLLCFWITLGD